MSQSKKEDVAARSSEEEILALATNPADFTDISDWDEAQASTSMPETPRHFTRIDDDNNNGERFCTPDNQDITVSYDSLSLTSTKMRPLATVLTEMIEDGAWDIRTGQQCLEHRLVIFLYGKGYYSNLPSEERIACIKNCISETGGNRRRLREIALSNQSRVVLAHNLGFDSYFFMASTARVFFEQPNARGGFHRQYVPSRRTSLRDTRTVLY